MICPRCGAPAVAGQQRFCQECGAPLLTPPAAAPVQPNAAHMPLQVVGDGSDQSMQALKQQAALEWLRQNQGRLVLYGAGIAVAVVVTAVIVITVLSVLATAVAAGLPFLAVLFFMGAYRGPRRRRHRHWRHWTPRY